jgi:leader peptidase (prepilin peptidase) / N-methyltransferase
MPEPGVFLFVAAFGLAVGSFLNVCIYRLPRGGSLLGPPSHCTVCDRFLRWYENIPVLSYLGLRGRCRTCHTRISPVYPIVEIATSATFVVMVAELGWNPLLVPRLLLGCALIVLALIDLEQRILPNVITVPGIVVGFAFSFFLPPGWVASLLGILVGGGSLLLIAEGYYRIRGQEGLGMGDVKMLAMIGAFLGWKLMLVALVLSSCLGSLVGVAMILARKGDMKYALPFGTFLAMGALLSIFFGEPIIRWYVSFY